MNRKFQAKQMLLYCLTGLSLLPKLLVAKSTVDPTPYAASVWIVLIYVCVWAPDNIPAVDWISLQSVQLWLASLFVPDHPWFSPPSVEDWSRAKMALCYHLHPPLLLPTRGCICSLLWSDSTRGENTTTFSRTPFILICMSAVYVEFIPIIKTNTDTNLFIFFLSYFLPLSSIIQNAI